MTEDQHEDEVLRLLRRAELEPLGRIASASNLTVLCRLAGDAARRLAIYKPERGEAPLWDFPPRTLHRREVAAYLVDRLLGWRMVPPTVLRESGPLGRGSVQLFVDHDLERHYFALVAELDDAITVQLRRMVAFDLVVNNADRKGSHVLLDAGGRVQLVDHGVCFHTDPKLRTVAWDFADEPVPAEVRADVAYVAEVLQRRDGDADVLSGLLTADEYAATCRRAQRVAQLERFPPPRGVRPYPWPPL
ncbi:MAG TPA: SCO1664 family protein [Nitriliruptorales bacterium]|nr:SCO1664 family protein [Nitriliruptorales bacterium]